MRQTGPDRKLSLLQAALDLFSTQGYDGTSTRAIAEKDGVTEGMLFKFFRTKDELLHAVLDELGPRKKLMLSLEPLNNTPLRESLDVMLSYFLDTFWEYRAITRMLFIATRRNQKAVESLREQFAEQTLVLEQFLNERSLRGEIREAMVPAVVEVISNAARGFIFSVLRSEPENWEFARSTFVNHVLSVVFDPII